MNEAWQEFSPWASQVVRLWANATAAFEVAWDLGPVTLESGEGGKEIVSRFSLAPWKTGGAFETDSNGREWQPRLRNARPDYNLSLTEPVAMNYYPVNTAIRIADAASPGVLTVLTDRTQGGASLIDGSLELMLHRRLLTEDGKGVMESLNEPGVAGGGLRVRGLHHVILSNSMAPAVRAHRAALQDALLPITVRGGALPAGAAPSAYASGLVASASLLLAPLPDNICLLTLHAHNATTALVRLAHLYEAGEDAQRSVPVNVSLANLFSSGALRVTGAREMTLTGGEPLDAVPPVTYRVQGVSGKQDLGGTEAIQTVTLPIVPSPPAGDALVITLAPMDIRTFLVSRGCLRPPRTLYAPQLTKHAISPQPPKI